jgi:hypothetical protein
MQPSVWRVNVMNEIGGTDGTDSDGLAGGAKGSRHQGFALYMP